MEEMTDEREYEGEELIEAIAARCAAEAARSLSAASLLGGHRCDVCFSYLSAFDRKTTMRIVYLSPDGTALGFETVRGKMIDAMLASPRSVSCVAKALSAKGVLVSLSFPSRRDSRRLIALSRSFYRNIRSLRLYELSYCGAGVRSRSLSKLRGGDFFK